MPSLTCKVDNQGRVMLPAEWRKRAHIGPSTELYVHEDDNGALILETAEQGLARAQMLVAQFVSPDDPSMADELIEDRRKEAMLESR
jgi:AbrB family looped-hinge helix DNA binding protein